MPRPRPRFVSCVVLLAWVSCTPCRGQDSTSRPPALSGSPFLLDAPLLPDPPLPESAPAVAVEAAPAPSPPRWVASVELGCLRPHFLGSGNQPGADLRWLASPTITIGYLLLTNQRGAALGLAGSYRNLASTGASGAVGDRLDAHLFDLDLCLRHDSASPWGGEFDFGLRIAKLFTDSRMDGGVPTSNSSDFSGGGLHVKASGYRRINHTPLALLCGVEWAGMIGENDATTGGSGGSLAQSQHGRVMDQLRFWAGLQWDWTNDRVCLRLTAGYQYEVWSHDNGISVQQALQQPGLAGNYPDTLRTHDDVEFHGPFVRAEVRY